MPPPPTRPFIWSWPRHETFHTCLLRYYYAYYASWGGWLPSAPPRTRTLYTLKRLLTRHQWAARHIHHAIARAIARLPTPPPPSLPDDEINAMREEFRRSRAHEYRADPAHIIGLHEHEYPLPLPPTEWTAIRDLVHTSLTQFLASPLFASLAQSPPPTILASAPTPVDFSLDGLTVRATPDLLLHPPPPAPLHLYEWSLAPPPARPQPPLLIDALAALTLAPARPITLTTYNPLTRTSAPSTPTPDDLENTRLLIRDSADEMLFPLDGNPNNTSPPEKNFDPNPNPACPLCPYARLCTHAPG